MTTTAKAVALAMAMAVAALAGNAGGRPVRHATAIVRVATVDGK